MSLTKQAIDEFKTLYRNTYGVILTDAEARIRANDLMSVYRSIYVDEQKCDDLNGDQNNERTKESE